MVKVPEGSDSKADAWRATKLLKNRIVGSGKIPIKVKGEDRLLTVSAVVRSAVLRQLALYADAQGRCYPSQTLIAKEVGADVKTVRSAYVSLDAEGLIRRKPCYGENGDRTSDLVTLVFRAIERLPLSDEQDEVPPGRGTPTPAQQENGLPVEVGNPPGVTPPPPGRGAPTPRVSHPHPPGATPEEEPFEVPVEVPTEVPITTKGEVGASLTSRPGAHNGEISHLLTAGHAAPAELKDGSEGGTVEVNAALPDTVPSERDLDPLLDCFVDRVRYELRVSGAERDGHEHLCAFFGREWVMDKNGGGRTALLQRARAKLAAGWSPDDLAWRLVHRYPLPVRDEVESVLACLLMRSDEASGGWFSWDESDDDYERWDGHLPRAERQPVETSVQAVQWASYVLPAPPTMSGSTS